MPAEYKALNGFLFGAAVFGLASPYPDFYNVYQVCKQVPTKCRVQFHKDDTYYIPPTND